MGMINGMELAIYNDTEYPTRGQAVRAGRAAAWERYDEWQSKAPHKTMSEFLRDQALEDMARQDAAVHAPDDGRQP